MQQMYEAMKRLARQNPEFAKQLAEAEQSRKDRIAQETKEQNARNRAAYEAKELQKQRDDQEKERQRREQELAILGNHRMYPFGYSYQDMGQYSVTYGIVFALTSEDAREAVVNKIKKYYEEDTGYKNKYDEEYHENALKTVRVWQLDLSDGQCGIGGYIE